MTEKRVAGVVIDDWKLSIFKKRLLEGGYTFTENPGVVKNTLLLRVETDNMPALASVISKANTECAQWKRRKKMH